MSEQAGLQLLAAIEALHAEIKGMREEMRADRKVAADLERLRKAAREKKARQRHRPGDSPGDTVDAKPAEKACPGDSPLNVPGTVPGTAQVVKALAVVVASQEQTTRTKNLQRPGTVPGTSDSPGDSEERPTVATRKAYASAFANRWGTDPLINKKANGMLKHFVDLVGQEAAPAVAAFYLSHNGALYVNAKHPINLLLRDANKLHTEWKTDTPSTETEARLKERTEANFGGWGKHLSTAKAGS